MIKYCEFDFFEIKLWEFYLFVFLDKLESVIKPHIFNVNHKLFADKTFNIAIIDNFMKISNIEIDFTIYIFKESSLFIGWIIMCIV
jgi:hypothetical protein